MTLPDFMDYKDKFTQSAFVEKISHIAKRAGAKMVHLVANHAQFLLIQADFFADGSCTVWHIKELLSLYNGHLFAVC